MEWSFPIQRCHSGHWSPCQFHRSSLQHIPSSLRAVLLFLRVPLATCSPALSKSQDQPATDYCLVSLASPPRDAMSAGVAFPWHMSPIIHWSVSQYHTDSISNEVLRSDCCRFLGTQGQFCYLSSLPSSQTLGEVIFWVLIWVLAPSIAATNSALGSLLFSPS